MRIDIPSILVQLRAQHVEEQKATHRLPTAEAVAMAAASWTMSTPRRFAAAEKASRGMRLLGGSKGRISTLPPPLSGWSSSRDAPVPPRETFREWWSRTRGRGS